MNIICSLQGTTALQNRRGQLSEVVSFSLEKYHNVAYSLPLQCPQLLRYQAFAKATKREI
jgi:hypothetical protein